MIAGRGGCEAVTAALLDAMLFELGNTEKKARGAASPAPWLVSARGGLKGESEDIVDGQLS